MKALSNKRLRYLLIGLMVAALLFVGLKACTGLFSGRSLSGLDPILAEAGKDVNHYEILVEFDPGDKTLECIQRVEYTNRSDETLTHLYFHLYPNAFKYEEKPVFGRSEMEQAYPNGFSPGYLTMERVYLDNTMVDFVIGGYSENLMMLLMNGGLAPGETVMIDMVYSVQLPDSMGRFGYGENTFKAANWYPIASVYDENGWNLDRYYAIGDPFYSEMANYRVSITAPSEYVIAATGDVVHQQQGDGTTQWEIEAVAVRDFAWLASDRFKVSSTEVDGTTVQSYYFTDSAGLKALEYAAAALEVYNEAFGRYPYNQFSVVESDFFIGGMEYPNLIMIDHRMYSASMLQWLELVTVHETAHQWWYGLVGNNQIREAWVDEALTEYATVLYYGLRYGPEREAEIYQEVIAEGKYLYLQEYARTLEVDETIHRPTYEFPDWILYDLLVYGKGAMMFHELREQIGDALFFQALQTYYEEYRFQNASGEDMIGIFNRITQQDWGKFFENWLYNKKDA